MNWIGGLRRLVTGRQAAPSPERRRPAMNGSTWTAVADAMPPIGLLCLVYAPPRGRVPELYAIATWIGAPGAWWPTGDRRLAITHWMAAPPRPGEPR